MDRNIMFHEEVRYVMTEQLGRGAYGTVWKAVDKATGEVCAMKRINKSFYKYEDCLNLAEVKCLQKLRPHPNILSLHDLVLDGTTLYLVVELMECDLSELMRRRRGSGRPFREQEVRNFLYQILKGLARMHEEGYCHRDLKPHNLLVRGDIIKIADFGLAKNMMLHQFDDSVLESDILPPPYQAPELLLGSTHYDFAIDIWAVGVIMVELFTGYQPFRASNTVHVMHKICSIMGSPDTQTWPQGLELAASKDYNYFPEEFRNVDSFKQLSSLLPPSVSASAIDLINSLFSWDPKRRPKAIEALQHPFFYPPLLLSYHSKAFGEQKRCDFLSDSKGPIGKAEYVSESVRKPFPAMGTSQITPEKQMPFDYKNQEGVEKQMPFDYKNQEDGLNSRASALTVRQLRPSSPPQYSIWQKESYLGSYKLPASLSIANLPSSPFPGMGPKMFKPTRVHNKKEDANSRPV